MNALNTAIKTALGTSTPAYLMDAANAALPYIVWSWQGGGLTDDHDLVSGLEWVRAYSTSALQAGSIYATFDAALNGGTLTVSGYNVVTLRRTDEIEMVEALPNGERVYTAGAMYRIMLDK